MSEYLRDIYVAVIAVIASFLFWLGNYDKYQDLDKNARARKLLFGMVGSAITSWFIFESLMYVEVPFRLSLALAAMIAYLGGECISNILVKFIEKRLDKV